MYKCRKTGKTDHTERKLNDPIGFFRPCQNCINCRLQHSQSWALRMCHESTFHDQNSFLTLTYDEKNLPSDGSLNYKHVVDFVKRLRRRLDSTIYKNSLTFYRVGEYGSNFSRPHYHMVLFGFNFTESLEYKGVRNIRTISGQKDDRKYYKSTFATDLWSHGFVDIGNVDFSTCMYVAKYVTKKLNNLSYRAILPEKSSCSRGYKNPLTGVRTSYPIGIRWIQKYYTDVYPHDYVIHNGKKYRPPRAYDEWLKIHQPELYLKVKEQRSCSIDDSYDPHQLYNAHFIATQKQKQFLRDGCAPNLRNDENMLLKKLQLVNEQKGIL